MGANGIGKRIAFLRKEKGVTQKQLAEFLCVTDKAVSRWESGVGNPDLDYLPQICDFFDVSLDYLIRGIKPKIEDPQPPQVEELQTPLPEKKIISKKAKILIASITTGALILVGAGVGIALGTKEASSSSQYTSAVKMMESGEYVNAIESFLGLSSYRDSQSKAEVCYGLISIDNSIHNNDYSLLKDGVAKITDASSTIDVTYDGKGKTVKDGQTQITAEISSLNPGLYEPNDVTFVKWNALSCFYLNEKTTLFLTAVWSN